MCWKDARLEDLQRPGDGLMHVIIFVITQTAADEDTLKFCCVLLVEVNKTLVGGRRDGIIGIVSLVSQRILAEDDRFVPGIVFFRVQVTGFVDPGIGEFRIGVIDDRVALVVHRIDGLLLEAKGAPAELSVFVVEKLVDGAAIDQACIGFELLSYFEEIGVQENADAFVGKQVLKQVGISFLRDPLPVVMEIIVVVAAADGDAMENGGWQVPRVKLPLFDGIVAKEGLVKVGA